MTNKIKRFKILRSRPGVIRLATLLLVVVGIGAGLYYRSLRFVSFANPPYFVQGYRVYEDDQKAFPAGVGTTTAGGLSTTDNSFYLDKFNGPIPIGSSSSINYNGVKYNLISSKFCYNYVINACPVGHSSTSSSNPHTASDPTNLPTGDGLYYVDVRLYYQPVPGAFSLSSPSQNTNSINLSWTTANKATSYTVLRGSQGIASLGGNSFTDTGLACGTGYAYTITASAKGGTTSSNTINVSTSACPSSGSGGGTPAPSTPRPSNPPLQGSGTPSSVPTIGPDTVAPTVPMEFMATPSEQGLSVQLSWQASTDDRGNIRYNLERSVDQQNWDFVQEGEGTFYSDQDVSFNTRYFYRVNATDSAGNASAHAITDITTPAFSGNVTPDQETILINEQAQAKAILPPGTVSEAASCSIEIPSEQIGGPEIKGYILVAGPLQILCKKADNSIIASFDQPISIEWAVSLPDNVSGLLDYYGDGGDGWHKLVLISHNKETGADNFTLDKGTIFVAMGKVKSTPVIVKIFIVFMFLILIGAAIVAFLYWRNRRQKQAAYDDYWHKMNGV